jgi:hypothetical protein
MQNAARHLNNYDPVFVAQIQKVVYLTTNHARTI